MYSLILLHHFSLQILYLVSKHIYDAVDCQVSAPPEAVHDSDTISFLGLLSNDDLVVFVTARERIRRLPLSDLPLFFPLLPLLPFPFFLVSNSSLNQIVLDGSSFLLLLKFFLQICFICAADLGEIFLNFLLGAPVLLGFFLFFELFLFAFECDLIKQVIIVIRWHKWNLPLIWRPLSALFHLLLADAIYDGHQSSSGRRRAKRRALVRRRLDRVRLHRLQEIGRLLQALCAVESSQGWLRLQSIELRLRKLLSKLRRIEGRILDLGSGYCLVRTLGHSWYDLWWHSALAKRVAHVLLLGVHGSLRSVYLLELKRRHLRLRRLLWLLRHLERLLLRNVI